jgi:hypothetical protein
MRSNQPPTPPRPAASNAILAIFEDNVDLARVAEMFRKQGAKQIRTGTFRPETVHTRESEVFVWNNVGLRPATEIRPSSDEAKV